MSLGKWGKPFQLYHFNMKFLLTSGQRLFVQLSQTWWHWQGPYGCCLTESFRQTQVGVQPHGSVKVRQRLQESRVLNWALPNCSNKFVIIWFSITRHALQWLEAYGPPWVGLKISCIYSLSDAVPTWPCRHSNNPQKVFPVTISHLSIFLY